MPKRVEAETMNEHVSASWAITFRQPVVIRRVSVRHFRHRFQKLLPAATLGAHGHVALVAPDADGLRDGEADDLLQRHVLAFRKLLRLLQHRLWNLGFNRFHFALAISSAFALERWLPFRNFPLPRSLSNYASQYSGHSRKRRVLK